MRASAKVFWKRWIFVLVELLSGADCLQLVGLDLIRSIKGPNRESKMWNTCQCTLIYFFIWLFIFRAVVINQWGYSATPSPQHSQALELKVNCMTD